MNKNPLTLSRLPSGKSWMAAALIVVQFACSANNDPALEYDAGSTVNPAGPAAPDNDSLAPADPRNPANWYGNGDLESGDGYWYPQGNGVTATRTTAQSHGGNYSLLVEGRTVDWHGPVMPLMKTLPSGQYEASVWVRLAAGEEASPVQLSLKTQIEGEEGATFTPISSAEVTASGWTRLSGTFQNNSPGRWGDIALYVESSEVSLSYYVDDLMVISLNNVIVNGGAEAGISPWRTQGGAMITLASEQRHGGNNSLLVTGRTMNWNGPVMDLPPLSVGRVYKGSVWVRLASGTPATQLNFTLKRTVVGGPEEYIQLGSAQVTASEWVELTGSFTHVASGTLQEHFLYIESIPEGAAASFYVDDLELAISQNALLNGDFESGTGGWFALGAAAPTDPPVPTVTIARSNEHSFSGSYSLLVTNREQQWHGPATNLNLTADNVYNVTCRVRLAAGSTATNAMITIKTTEDMMDTYTQAGAAPATAEGWAELSGVFIYDPIGTVTELLMYVHTESDTASYYTDTCAVTPQ